MRAWLMVALFTGCGSSFPRVDAGPDVDAGTDAGVCDAGPACPPVAGGPCIGGVVCESASTGLDCVATRWVSFPCRGPAGCMSMPLGPTCDFNGALAGDRCPNDVEGRQTCSVSGRQVIACRSGVFVETLSCSSCTLSAGVVTCIP
jgi:hypothetical protein